LGLDLVLLPISLSFRVVPSFFAFSTNFLFSLNFFENFSYNRIRSFTNTSPKYPFFDNLLAGSITGGIILSLTNPFWVCKTRMCLQYEHLVNEKQFSGLVGCLKNVWKTEGLRGFYKVF